MLDGGAGEDKLVGAEGDDLLRGGDGNDTIDGADGRDRIEAGAGDDLLAPDGYEHANADVVDGGPGFDRIEGDYSSRFSDTDPPVAITFGGGADDGRPGEGDDLRSVEKVWLSVGGSFTGTDGADEFRLSQVGTPSTMNGLGGDDRLRSGDGADRLDGGAGNDSVDGGFGDDELIGGPGRDTISGDLAGGDCGPLWCRYPYGNDTIQARDGEVDSITCGAGTDTVNADAQDVVAPDCENVVRGGSGATPGPGASPGSSAKGGEARAEGPHAPRQGPAQRLQRPRDRREGRAARQADRAAATASSWPAAAPRPAPPRSRVKLRFTKAGRKALKAQARGEAGGERRDGPRDRHPAPLAAGRGRGTPYRGRVSIASNARRRNSAQPVASNGPAQHRAQHRCGQPHGSGSTRSPDSQLGVAAEDRMDLVRRPVDGPASIHSASRSPTSRAGHRPLRCPGRAGERRRVERRHGRAGAVGERDADVALAPAPSGTGSGDRRSHPV